MKIFISIAIIFGVISVGTLLISPVGHDSSMITGCVLQTVQPSPCPEDMIAMVSHHIDAYASFLTAIPSVSLLILLTLSFVSFLLIKTQLSKKHLKYKSRIIMYRIRLGTEGLISIVIAIINWLSLFENSPSFA